MVVSIGKEGPSYAWKSHDDNYLKSSFHSSNKDNHELLLSFPSSSSSSSSSSSIISKSKGFHHRIRRYTEGLIRISDLRYPFYQRALGELY